MRKGYIGANPLNYENGHMTGAYRLVSRVSESVLNPGDTLVIDQYITGYGDNSGIKIVTFPSQELFEESESSFRSGLRQNEQGWIQWGHESEFMQNGGLSTIPSSMKNINWDAPAAIFDISENTNFVITERALGHAPFSYRLKLKKNATPGPHYISFNMTYFNGTEWVCQEEKTNFKVNNKFEEHSALLSTLALIALMVTIFSDGLVPLIKFLHGAAKFVNILHAS